jgi:ABC-2 type transport system permease protein
VNLALPLNYKNTPLVPDPDNEANKKCLAGLSEGYYQSYFKNRLPDEYVKNTPVKVLDSSTVEGKVFLVGNGRFIANQYDSMLNKMGTAYMYRPKQFNDLQFSQDLADLEIPHLFGNQEFFQNMVDYMMGDNSVLDIRSRQIDLHEIDKAKVQESASFYRVVNIGLPVSIVLLLAVGIFFIRRKKYAY